MTDKRDVTALPPHNHDPGEIRQGCPRCEIVRERAAELAEREREVLERLADA